MNTAALIALIVGIVALLFGAWGRFSSAGRSQFDEMAGIIPMAAWYGGIGLILLTAGLWLTMRLRR